MHGSNLRECGEGKRMRQESLQAERQKSEKGERKRVGLDSSTADIVEYAVKGNGCAEGPCRLRDRREENRSADAQLR